MIPANITATKTALPSGKTRYVVEQDGAPVYSMESKVPDYAVIHIQMWTGTGPDRSATDWAPRFSRKPKAPGARIEYGFCAGNVPITTAAAA